MKRWHPLKLAGLSIGITLSLTGKAVLNGEEVGPDEYPATFSITTGEPGFEYACSGTLLHPKLLITAGHCLTGEGMRVKYVLNGPSTRGMNEYLVQAGTAPVSAGAVALADRFGVAPGYRERGGDESATSYDVGYVLLKEPLENVEPADVRIIPLATLNQNLLRKTVTIVGYGASQDGDDLSRTQGIKRKGSLEVVRVRPQFFQAQGESQSPLEGDSGGSVYLDHDGKPALVGVISGESTAHTQRRTANFSLLTRQKLCWIEKDSRIDLPQVDCSSARPESPSPEVKPSARPAPHPRKPRSIWKQIRSRIRTL